MANLQGKRLMDFVFSVDLLVRIFSHALYDNDEFVNVSLRQIGYLDNKVTHRKLRIIVMVSHKTLNDCNKTIPL